MLTEKQLAGITISPRAKVKKLEKRHDFRVSKDPAVKAIARMIVAGVDKKFGLYPNYRSFVKAWGKEKAHELIESAIKIRGACDVMQTDMNYGGLGLFGGLSEDGSKFIFYEWVSQDKGQLFTSMTLQEARDIVSGKKKLITFKLVR